MRNLAIITFIFMITYINSKCGAFYPRDASQCVSYSDDNSLCCHLTRFDIASAFSVCHKIPIAKYAEISEKGYLTLGINNYTEINCGSLAGASCTMKVPKIPEDCYELSATGSNCCMINPPNRQPRCVYSGNTYSAYYTTPNGFVIKCFLEVLKISQMLLVLVFLMYI